MKSLGFLLLFISALAAGVAAFAGQTSAQVRATPTPTYRPTGTPPVYLPKATATPTAQPTPKRPDDPRAYSYFSRGNEDYAAAEYLILTRQATQGSGPKRESAIANYTKAIEIDPKFARAYMQRGMAIAMLNFNNSAELRKAIADHDTCITLEPTATAYFERAKAKMRLAPLDKSVSTDMVLSDLSEGIKLDPKSFPILNARAQIYFATGKYDLALADVNESLRLFPLQSPVIEFKKQIEAKIAASGGGSTTTKLPAMDMDSYIAKIQKQGNAGQTPAAIATATECIAAFPSSVPCYKMRGQLTLTIYLEKPIDVGNLKLGGKQDQEPEWLAAVADLTKAISISPQFADLYYQRGLIYIQGYNTEPFELAIADAKKALELQPPHQGARSLLQKATDGYASGLSSDANEKWARAAALREQRKDAEALKVLNEGISEMTKAIEIGPAYSRYLMLKSRSRMYRDLKKYDLAVEDNSKALELYPNCGDCYIERAEIYRTQKKYDLVFADYDKLLSRPDETDTTYAKERIPIGRADTYREMGKYDQAIAEYSKIIAADPKRQDAQWGLALAYHYKGDKMAAEAEFQKALAISWNPKALREEITKLGVVLAGSSPSAGNLVAPKASPATPTSTSTGPNDEARYTQVATDLAAGKTVSSDDITWALRYEQQKKTSGKPAAAVVPATSTTSPSAPVNLANGVFFDDFVDNKNNWGTGDTSEFISAIANGKYQLRTKIFTFYTTILPFEAVPKIDQTKDFTIETEFTVLSGQPTYPVSLIWGVSRDLKSRHAFGLMPNRSFFKGKHTDGPWIGQLASSVPEPTKKGFKVVTKLLVKQRGSMIELYVNDIKVATTPYETFILDSSIGFQVNGDQSVSVNYLKIAQQ